MSVFSPTRGWFGTPGRRLAGRRLDPGRYEVFPLEPRLLLSGTTYMVDSLADVVAADGLVTLREAIQAANTNVAVNEAAAGSATGTDLITFDPQQAAGTIALIGAPLTITEDVDILGLGETQLIIESDPDFRTLHVASGVTANIEGMTITRGDEWVPDLPDSGGIVNEGTLVLTAVTVSDNWGETGGGILNDGTLTLMNSVVSDNAASIGGGIANYGTMTMVNSKVSDNGYWFGGGIENQGTLTMVGSVISGNTGEGGGGICNHGPLTVVNSVICGNFGDSRGGGMILYAGDVTVTNSTIAGNSTEGFGGGIGAVDLYATTLTLNNSIVSLNVADSESDVGMPYSGSHNVIGGDPGFIRNPSAGPDATWGTDDDDLGDLRLRRSSPAVDFGNNALAVDPGGNPLTVDIAGNPRIAGTAVDVGAYEFHPIPGDADGDSDVDLDDFAILKTNFGTKTGAVLDEGDFDGDGDVDLDDFVILKKNFGT